jgi:hypothetical protein
MADLQDQRNWRHLLVATLQPATLLAIADISASETKKITVVLIWLVMPPR